MDNKTNNKRELDIGSSTSAASALTTTSPAALSVQQRRKRIKSQPASETKVVQLYDYLHPVVFKNKRGELYQIHVDIIEKSDVINASIDDNILNLPEYYNEPEFTYRIMELLNIIVTDGKLPDVRYAEDIKLCQILHKYNIKLSEIQCAWFAELSMYIGKESKAMCIQDISCVLQNDQIFPYVVDHIVNRCKTGYGRWTHYNLLKNLNNQAVFDAVLQKIFNIAIYCG